MIIKLTVLIGSAYGFYLGMIYIDRLIISVPLITISSLFISLALEKIFRGVEIKDDTDTNANS